MKKLLVLGLIISVISIYCSANTVQANESDTKVIKEAISKYKAKNYLGCISDLRLLTEKDPKNAVAWYYLGNSYMYISMKEEAHAAFEKVIELNTVPQLTSYSIQAKLCMENKEKCKYQDFTLDEIQKLKRDPVKFLEEYLVKQQNLQKFNAPDAEITKLINGQYPNNIHSDAQSFITSTKTNMEKDAINMH